ncbi:transglutaminase family protein [Paraburkholderia sp. J12]|uniref:transglutaminase family protein n=1 Tax=Paraburkholderia sp. J12 TaxID=2805432 RepID=UPI002ABDD8CC|nr:transglutaminase family protein [Paraburkholderia sp. J12]
MSKQGESPPYRVLRVTHETGYRYEGRVEYASHVAWLRPVEQLRQKLLNFAIEIDPRPDAMTSMLDAFGNHRIQFAIDRPHDHLSVRTVSTVGVHTSFATDDFACRTTSAPASTSVCGLSSWEEVRQRFAYSGTRPFDRASEFIFPSPFVPCHSDLARYAAASFTPGRPLLEAAWHLMGRIHTDFEYSPGATDVKTTALDALALRRGVCQDFAHVMIGALRSIGLAARYVSGYLMTYPAPGCPRLIGADASHAWVAVYDPLWKDDGGWMELDPTNNRAPGSDYVTLGIGRDYSDVTPLRGIIHGGGVKHDLSVAVTVEDDESAR